MQGGHASWRIEELGQDAQAGWVRCSLEGLGPFREGLLIHRRYTILCAILCAIQHFLIFEAAYIATPRNDVNDSLQVAARGWFLPVPGDELPLDGR